MVQYSWLSAVSGEWNDPSNWSPHGGPFGPAPSPAPFGGTTADTAVFDTGSRKGYTVSGGGQAASVTVSHDTVTFTDFAGGDSYGQSTFNVDDGATVTLAAGSDVQMLGHFATVDGTVHVDRATFIDKGVVLGNLDFGAGARVFVNGPSAVMASASSVLAAGSVLTVENGGAYSSSENIVNGIVRVDGSTSIFGGSTVVSNGGVMALGDGTLGGDQGYYNILYGSDVRATGGLATVDKGGFVVGNGTIYPDNQSGGPALASDTITDNGSIVALEGTLKILGSVDGRGTLDIGPRSTLELEGNASNNVVFLSQATLLIGKGVHETGFLRAFGVGDKVDLAGQASTSETVHLAGTTTILDLYNKSTLADQLMFKGHFTRQDFTVSKDGSGGTLVALDPHVFHAVIPSI